MTLFMKTALREFLFVICCLYFCLIVLQYCNTEHLSGTYALNLLLEKIPDRLVIPELPYFLRSTKLYFFVVLCFLACSILVRMSRWFVHSKNRDGILYIFSYITFFLVGFPIAHLFTYLFFYGSLRNSSNQSDDAAYIKIMIIYVIAFYVIARLLAYFLQKAYVILMNKPTKNYTLLIRSFKMADSVEVSKVVVRNMRFMECYNLVRSYAEPMQMEEFFTIAETNWTGRKTIDSWNYDRTGELIENLEEEIRKQKALDKNVKWGV